MARKSALDFFDVVVGGAEAIVPPSPPPPPRLSESVAEPVALVVILPAPLPLDDLFSPPGSLRRARGLIEELYKKRRFAEGGW